ncbi:MAG: nitroreductase family protein [Alphaproteobacteria bacterium]
MDAMDALLNRSSVPAKLLAEPAPAGAELDEILATAMRAPDHGALRPWRFLTIRGEARRRLGEVFAEALCRRDPLATEDMRQKELGRPLRSPLILVVYAEIVANHPKVPRVEQVVAAAAAAQNVLLAAHAKGYGGIMLTGANAHDTHVKTALGIDPDNEIVTFLYLGTPVETPRQKPRPDPAAFCREWNGPVQSGNT